jgi:DNA polymerase III subunit chi
LTEIDFHTKVPDVPLYACRILRIAYNRGARVTVFHNDPAQLRNFDEQLWCFSPLDFIPHVYAGDPDEADTPIILTFDSRPLKEHQVILNLSMERPPQFSSFERMVEFVPAEGDALVAARERYKFYKDRGYPIKTHEFREMSR